MKFRVAAIAVIDHALASITDDCINGIGQKYRKNASVALMPGEVARLKAKVNEIVASTKANYPKAPAARPSRRYRSDW